jgi:hypothetical protein
LDDLIELGPLEPPVDVCPAEEAIERLLVPVLRRGLGYDLLGQHIERILPDDDPI